MRQKTVVVFPLQFFCLIRSIVAKQLHIWFLYLPTGNSGIWGASNILLERSSKYLSSSVLHAPKKLVRNRKTNNKYV